MNGEKVLPAIIYTPQERKQLNVEGITTSMLIKYIDNILAQAVASIDDYPLYLILDKSSIHQKEKMIEAFRDRNCQDLVDIIYMPTKSAKRLSPLDNAFFHEWKQKVRKFSPLSKKDIVTIIDRELHNISSDHIANYYRLCGLTHGQDPYKDCPKQSSHQHV